MGGREGSLPLAWAGSPSGTRERCARGMRRAPRKSAKSGFRRLRRPARRLRRASWMGLSGGLPRADRGGFCVATTAEPRMRRRASDETSRAKTNTKKFGWQPEGARGGPERGTHAHDGRGRLPRPLPRDGGTHGAPQVSTGRKEAWRCKPVGVEGGGAGEEYGELGGRCGVGRPRPVGLLRWVRVCAPAGARRRRCDFFLEFSWSATTVDTS